MKQSKMSKFTIFYIVSAILVALLFVLSFTFAWYVKSTSKTIGILFSKPIVIMLNSDIKEVRDEVVVGDADKLLPGSKVKVNLGFRMADISTTAPAFVRARLGVDFDSIYDETGWDDKKYITYDLSVTDTSGQGYTWTKVNFSKSGKLSGEWYVLTGVGNSSDALYQAQPGQVFDFLKDKNVELSKEITNDFAEKQIRLYFTVEAVQTNNVNIDLKHPLLSDVWVED